MSPRPLLDPDHNAPVLVINGADDAHVSQDDMRVFPGRRDAEAELIPDTGHCAVSNLGDVLLKSINWLSRALRRSTKH
jgi:esterase FrsA